MHKCKELVNNVCFFCFCKGSNSSYVHFLLLCFKLHLFVFISSLFSAFIFVIAQEHMTLNQMATDMARIARRMLPDSVRFLLF